MINRKTDLAKLEKTLKVIDKMYDIARLVEPVKGSVDSILSGEASQSEASALNCYHLWQQVKPCQNCISSRALNENDAFMKIEYNGEKLYMITAIPLELAQKRVVLELIKDITNNGIVGIDICGQASGKVGQIINSRNEAVVKDELTRVYNKRYIYERLPFDILKSLTDKVPLTVIMADIDAFKRINDNYGHVAGDYVLRGFAKALKRHIRKDKDWVARYGGDEFLVVMCGTDSKAAYNIAERIRRKVEGAELTYQGQPIRITGSFGGCALQREVMVAEKLIECADKNLYKAKKEGRNRVCF